MGPARCLAPKVTCLRYPSSSPPSSIILYTLILWSDNLPSKYCPNNFPFAQLWYKSKWIVTAEIGSLLINKEQKFKTRYKDCIDWLIEQITKWIGGAQMDKFIIFCCKNKVFKLSQQPCRGLRYLRLRRDKAMTITEDFICNLIKWTFCTHLCLGAGWWRRNPWGEGGPDLPGTRVHTGDD